MLFDDYVYKKYRKGNGDCQYCSTLFELERSNSMEDQKQRVYDALNKMGIKYEVVEHEPVHTMEDMDRLGLPEKRNIV